MFLLKDKYMLNCNFGPTIFTISRIWSPISKSDHFGRPHVFELKIGDVICFKWLGIWCDDGKISTSTKLFS